jgi:hypothetical protein
LILPANDAIINNEDLVLIWDGNVKGDYNILYDVYLSIREISYPYPKEALLANSISGTELTVEKLIPYTTYYWTVIPSTENGFGSCDSGVWSFYYDPSGISYILRIHAETQVKLKIGTSYSMTVAIENIGKNPDIVIPRLNAGNAGHAATFEDEGKRFYLNPGDSINLRLNISAEKLSAGTYQFTISVKSLGNNSIETSNIEITVYDPDSKESKNKEGVSEGQFYFIVISIIFILISLFVFFIVRRNKELEDKIKRMESEMLKKKPEEKMLAPSEVKYLPGIDETKGMKALPQLPPGEDVEDEHEITIKTKEMNKSEKEKEEEHMGSAQRKYSQEELFKLLEKRHETGEISDETYLDLKGKYSANSQSREPGDDDIIE